MFHFHDILKNLTFQSRQKALVWSKDLTNFIPFFENSVDLICWLKMKQADRDPHFLSSTPVIHISIKIAPLSYLKYSYWNLQDKYLYLFQYPYLTCQYFYQLNFLPYRFCNTRSELARVLTNIY